MPISDKFEISALRTRMQPDGARPYTGCTMIMRVFISLFAGLLTTTVFALNAASLTVTQPWSRATAPGATVGAVYFDIVNGGTADTLIRIESPVAKSIEMHESKMQGDSMQMRQVKAVHIPAKGRVRFESGGLHVMLVDLKQPLKAGDKFPLRLVFRAGGTVDKQVVVQSLTASGPPGS
jgi:copper(I)-binding protein